MPIKLEKNLPAVDILRTENIFVMDHLRAGSQDIRPIKILILNLMPNKIVTETQLLRLLANTPLQLEVEFLYMASHESKNTHSDHLDQFYKDFSEVREEYFDGLIVTGAPVENLPFEEVDYWSELLEVFNWAKSHVYSTLHICWGAQAGLYARYGVAKHALKEKLSGVYSQQVLATHCPLMRGFDDQFKAPHSRYTEVRKEDIQSLAHLKILSAGPEVGLSILASHDLREVYSFGHLEYDRDTLQREYQRDCAAGKSPNLPHQYFPEDDLNRLPCLTWNLAAAQFFTNWINYAVYQETPFDWSQFDSTERD
ncbi:TPA: homoserine O-succinyltransferase [Streptococcus suis]|uniref:Homoserine O-acetyltransferase n=1 Tax=Streptococcus suivaginalis TaxID=3028082 RepID=A0AA97A058_9STRE|nr:homoserine O-succinyltransferase [Streptococcus sp. 29896]MCK4027885.1 homoserine O-succinyltransferase [Streptococcus suis]WNY46340.1 homoserine O-succinyltransferase [Streptococcus sp. 29896]HEL1586934.1 homoserine O-succinyltransferase [Streptococcus suis]HEL2057456.1 homoserine O-succinyltransferase [Streptococcus suis]